MAPEEVSRREEKGKVRSSVLYCPTTVPKAKESKQAHQEGEGRIGLGEERGSMEDVIFTSSTNEGPRPLAHTKSLYVAKRQLREHVYEERLSLDVVGNGRMPQDRKTDDADFDELKQMTRTSSGGEGEDVIVLNSSDEGESVTPVKPTKGGTRVVVGGKKRQAAAGSKLPALKSRQKLMTDFF
mmetsp:Transcript_18433/g.30291  ORF Transcript_18433/g.30291 Transcript_18433/m.30291 type:complete len:183 (-) Transcript_18433:80-628(-)